MLGGANRPQTFISSHKVNFWIEEAPPTALGISESKIRPMIDDLFRDYHHLHPEMGIPAATSESLPAAVAYVNAKLAAKGINARLIECPTAPAIDYANVLHFDSGNIKVTGCYNAPAVLIWRPSV